MDPQQYQNFQSHTPPAPVKRSSGGLSPKLLFLGAGILLLVIAVFGLITLTRSSNPAQQMQRLSARFESLGEILALGDSYIQSQDLKKVHSDASILIKGDAATVGAAMETAGLGKVEKDVKAAEADTETLETLNDARLNGRFDDAYKKALAQKIESTMALMREVNDKTNSRALKSSLSNAYEHQSTILDELAKL